MSCPLCANPSARPSWLGATSYAGRQFEYVECTGCRSLYCDPMPDDATLAQMYGGDYQTCWEYDPRIEDPKEPDRVLTWLEREPAGFFVDYGCGKGDLLAAATRLGWQCAGVEFDPQVADDVSRRTGAPVYLDPAALLEETGRQADVLHLGDVIEHLTALDRQMPEILSLLRPDGLLLAQGPLEANANLFTLVWRVARSLRRQPRIEMAPYHVLLATAVGQRAFFRRFGVREVECRLREVAWPAPRRLGLTDLAQPRAVSLYFLRRASQGISALSGARLCNRYFYAGRRCQ